MSTGVPFYPPGFVPAQISPEWEARLRRRQEAILQLLRGLRAQFRGAGMDQVCTALEYLLGSEIDEILRQIANPKPAPRPSIDDLERAQREVEQAQQNLALLEKALDGLPAEMAEYFESTQSPGLEQALKNAEAYRDMIQRAMEAPGPTGPWDGSHRIGTMCAICARNFDKVETSIPALKVALKEAGWGRDQDGDHICPSCIAASLAKESS